jgi:hypothetical protein
MRMLAAAPHTGGERTYRHALLKGVRTFALRRFRKYVIY